MFVLSVRCQARPNLHGSCVGLQTFVCFERADPAATCSHLQKGVTVRGAEKSDEQINSMKHDKFGPNHPRVKSLK